MVGRLRRLRRPAKGAVLVEFAMSALLLFMVLLGTVEFGVEIYARNTTDRLANRVAEAYASSRDPQVARAVLDNGADSLVRRCLADPGLVLFDGVAGADPLRGGGRPASTENRADPDAVAFRVDLTCTWPRLTPVLGGLLGSENGYTATAFSRFRTEVGP